MRVPNHRIVFLPKHRVNTPPKNAVITVKAPEITVNPMFRPLFDDPPTLPKMLVE